MAVFEDPNATGTHLFTDLLTDLVTGVDAGSGSVAGIGILMAILVVTFIGTINFGFGRTLAFTGLFGTVVSMLLASLGWAVNSTVIFLMIVMFLIGMFLVLREDG